MSHNSLDSAMLLDVVEDCSLLHSGGEADIYKVSAAGKDYILKWYKSNCSFDTAVLDAVSKSKNPGHFQLREFGTRKSASGEKTPYLLYDFIDGISSDGFQKLPAPVALYALRRLVSTLSDLRKVNVSHGDLSPSNIVFAVAGTKDSKALQPVVIDFGIVGPGALAYAAPERFQGQAPSEKSDLFSLGLLLYRWIAGENLITAKDFEEYAATSASIDCTKVSEKLYVNGVSAQELSALEPIWAGLLCSAAEDRVEDFDELDEILEIALDKISGGQVALTTTLQNFIGELELGKVGTKVPTPEKCDLPYEILTPSKQNKLGKIFVFAVSGLILLLVALWLLLGTKGSDIDATGAMLLKQSRNLEQDSAHEAPLGDVPVDEILQDLPVPVSGKQSNE